MPSLPELQSAALKWQRRISQLSNAGYNPAPITELARTDLSRIAQGGTPLPEDQIISMVHSAYTGNVATPTPQTSQSGTDWNPLHVVGNIGHDITTDVRSAIPGLVHEAADIFNPSKWEELGTALSQFQSGSISDMAKEVQTLPILGPLVPGMFALSAGTSGITHHPLNFLLDVAAVASAGTTLASKAGMFGAEAAAEGSTLAALQDGHPVRAILRSTGIESDILNKMAAVGSPAESVAMVKAGHYIAGTALGLTGLKDSQFAHMPFWRQLGETGRIYTRMAQDQYLHDLEAITGPLSMEERRQLSIEAATFNTRYETRAVPLQPQDVAAMKSAAGDMLPRLPPVPQGRDFIGYRLGDAESPLESGTVYLTQQDAIRALGRDIPSEMAQNLVHEVRIDPNSLTVHDGVFTAQDIIPNKYVPPERVKVLNSIRDFTDRYSTSLSNGIVPGRGPMKIMRGKAGQQSVILDNELTGKSELFPRTTLPVKKQAAYAEASKAVQSTTEEISRLQATVSDLTHEATGQVETYQSFDQLRNNTPAPPMTPSLDALYQSTLPYILRGMRDDALRPLLQRLDNAFRADSPRQVASALSSLRRQVRDPEIQNYLDYVRGKLGKIGAKSTRAQSAKARLTTVTTQLQDAQKRLQLQTYAQETAKKKFYQALKKHPSPRMQPLVQEQVRAMLQDKLFTGMQKDIETATETARMNIQAGGLSSAIKQAFDEYTSKAAEVNAAHSREELARVVDTNTFKQVEKAAFQDWTRMIQAGADPIWIHQIDPKWAEGKLFTTVTPLTHEFLPTQDKRRIFDYSPHVLDIHAQLTHQGMEYFTDMASRDFIDYMINKSGLVHEQRQVLAEMQRRYGDFVDAKRHIANEYDTWRNPYDPKKTYLIPKAINKGLQQYSRGPWRLPIVGGAHMTGLRVFKLSVLTGPRHMVHVGIGGLVQVALQEPGALLELAHPRVLFDIVVNGKIPEELSHLDQTVKDALTQRLSKGMYEEHTSQLHAYRGGNKLGQWLRQSLIGRGVHKAEDRINLVENTTTDMYRAAIGLHAAKSGADAEAMLALVNKTLIDVDNLTPFERTVIRQIFPFWTFTKHILRYVLAYPADHPLRASILAHLAMNMEDTNASGDPARLSKLFMLGSPDAAGNVTSVDFSNLNPFRSMSSVFSMSGFLSGLAPEFQLALERFGINTLTGTPSLYQNYSYDTYTGTNRADRPSWSPFDFARAYIPQVDILDHFLLFTDNMRQLAKNNPEAYQRALYQEMNLPFAVAPINIYDVRAKAAAAQFRDAQNVVANAFKTGDTSALRSYVSVPFQGLLYPAENVANYIDYYDQLFPGISPKAVARKPKVRRTK